MKALLIYYTGTYNTRYISELVKKRFEKEGIETKLYEINPKNNDVLDLEGYDLIGLGYPIYGFNAPWPFLKFIRKQHFPEGVKTFIYKNSGETYHANDASSVNVVRKLKKDKAVIENEYHFIMPYNIHFRFDDELIREMLEIDRELSEILAFEVLGGISNIKKYKFIHRLITFCVKLQFIGGDVNSFLYRVKPELCSNCGLCIKKCPTANIYRDKKGRIKFHHNCLMCMRCSFCCPKDAIRIGFLEGWRVNGPYDLKKLEKQMPVKEVITNNTTGFFSCYIETYETVRKRYREITELTSILILESHHNIL